MTTPTNPTQEPDNIAPVTSAIKAEPTPQSSSMPEPVKELLCDLDQHLANIPYYSATLDYDQIKLIVEQMAAQLTAEREARNKAEGAYAEMRRNVELALKELSELPEWRNDTYIQGRLLDAFQSITPPVVAKEGEK